jgi:solute:Na+ symporter, SSS family
MHLHWIDWTIVFCFLLGIGIVALFTSTYMRGVADFLAANRCAGRYIVGMAEGMSGLGVIAIVGAWEHYYQAGFGAQYWSTLLIPIGMVLALSGWIIYRFRETRALTMAQFLEMRYSRNFRVFAGIMAFISGVINYGIFPAVTARFFIYFCGLPIYELKVLSFNINLTLALVMAVMLTIALMITLFGGLIAVMVTDFLQWIFVTIVFLLLIAFLIWKFSWTGIIDGLLLAPDGQSRINPFKQGELPDFNPMYYVMMAILTVYSYMIWQGSQGYNAAAKSPHEAQMGRIIGYWRTSIISVIMLLVPLCAFVVMNSSDYTATAAAAQQTIESLPTQQLQAQMRTPIVLAQLLPVGLMGLVCAVMMAGAIATDDTYLHSWGSILIQDVVLPLRGKPLDPKQHLQLLRISIVGVAIFAWTFSLLFPLDEYIQMYFMLTGAIFMGGAGSAVIGGLYWPRGTTSGAWAGMITGSILSVLGILTRNVFWPNLENLKAMFPTSLWLKEIPETCPLNGVEMASISAIAASMCYIIVSLLSRNPHTNMDQLLHRGRYDTQAEHSQANGELNWFYRSLGISPEFTRGDRWIYFIQVGWVAFWFSLFMVLLIWNLIDPWPDSSWVGYWEFVIYIMLVTTVVTVCWFLIGGTHDLFDLIKRLRTVEREDSDDGTVSHEDIAT